MQNIVAVFFLAVLTGCAGMAQKGALDIAYGQMEKGRYDRALRKLSEAQHYKTPLPAMAAEISFLRGQCYDRSGRPWEAIGAYSYTVTHFPNTTYSVQAQERLKVLKLTPRGEILHYGLCHRLKKGEKLGDTPANYLFEFASSTNRVPAVLGMGFGIIWAASGLPENQDVTISSLYLRPPSLTANGEPENVRRGEMIAHTSDAGLLKGDSVFLFDHPQEIVTGDWTIQIWYSGQELTEKTFTVFNPVAAKQR